jgi:hypothetical protein
MKTETVFGVSGVATKKRVKNSEMWRLSKVLVQPSCGFRSDRNSALVPARRVALSAIAIGANPYGGSKTMASSTRCVSCPPRTLTTSFKRPRWIKRFSGAVINEVPEGRASTIGRRRRGSSSSWRVSAEDVTIAVAPEAWAVRASRKGSVKPSSFSRGAGTPSPAGARRRANAMAGGWYKMVHAPSSAGHVLVLGWAARSRFRGLVQR